jgi:hypothetical protein
VCEEGLTSGCRYSEEGGAEWFAVLQLIKDIVDVRVRRRGWNRRWRLLYVIFGIRIRWRHGMESFCINCGHLRKGYEERVMKEELCVYKM